MISIPLIQQLCQGWRLSQIKTFSVVWSAFLQCKSGILNDIAEEITKQTGVAITHTVKRIQRFLGNENIDQRIFYRNITRFIYRRIRHWETIPIAIDWTHCEKHEPWKTLAASIVVRGRGIPILIWPFRKDSLDGYLSQNHIEEAFLKELKQIVPVKPNQSIVILADRAFARAELFQYTKEALGLDFVIRCKYGVIGSLSCSWF